MFLGRHLARTEAVHSEDVHDAARHFHAAFFAAPFDKGEGSRGAVEGPGSDRGINPHPLRRERATIQQATGVPFDVRIQPIRMSTWFFAVSYLGLQKIPDRGILMIPLPEI